MYLWFEIFTLLLFLINILINIFLLFFKTKIIIVIESYKVNVFFDGQRILAFQQMTLN